MLTVLPQTNLPWAPSALSGSVGQEPRGRAMERKMRTEREGGER